MKDLILIGGGGHCKSCINVIEETGQYNIIGIIDLKEKGSTVLDYKVIGTDEIIKDYVYKDISFCISIGQMDPENRLRCHLFKELESLKASLPVIISPNAIVSKYSKLEKGTTVFSSAIINANSEINKNCIINNRVLIEHDVIVGSNCHISTGAIINGNCSIGQNCMIGSASVIRNGITIAPNTMVGMGAVVTKSITESGVYYGNPARKINI